MNNDLVKKAIVFGIAMVFVFITFIPAVNSYDETSDKEADNCSRGDTSGWSTDDTVVNLGVYRWLLLGGTSAVTAYSDDIYANLTQRGTRGLGVSGQEEDEIDSYDRAERIEITFDSPQCLMFFEVRSLFKEFYNGVLVNEEGDVDLYCDGIIVCHYHIVGEELMKTVEENSMTDMKPICAGNGVVNISDININVDRVVFYVNQSEPYAVYSEFAVAKLGLSSDYISFVVPFSGIDSFKSIDVDNDNNLEYAINADCDDATGYELYKDIDGISTSVISIDGDNDGKIDHFIDINSDGVSDKYWDPDDNIITDVYTLSIDIVGSGTVIKVPDQTAYMPDTVVTLTAVADVGWSFVGWMGDLNSTDNPDTITMDGDKTVTATFNLKEYTLTVLTDGTGSGTVTKLPDQETYTHGMKVDLTAIPDFKSDFISWSGDLIGNKNPDTIVMDGDKTVTATFNLKEYTLTITIDGSGTVTKNPDQPTYTYDTTVDLEAIADVDWLFNNWSGDVPFGHDEDNPLSIVMDDNKSVTVHFWYTLPIEIIGCGWVDKHPNQMAYPVGDNVELTAVPCPGWSFVGWSGDVSGCENPIIIIVDPDKVIIATFTQDEYTLTVDVVGSGSVDVVPVGPYHYNDVVMLTAVADVNWSFVGWTGDLSGSTNPDTITMDGDKTVTATFNLKEYTLTVTVDPIGSGSVILDPPGGVYEHGTDVTLTADPNVNWFFTEWTGDLTGGVNPKTITMDGDKTVTAWFVQGWDATVHFSANIASIRTDNLTFGESGLASDDKENDGLDLPKPPAPEAPYVYAHFATGMDEPYDVLWKEYRKYPADSQVWDLWVDVDTTGVGQTTWVTITWDTAAIIASGYLYVGLHDYSGAFIRDMRSTDHYYFEAQNGYSGYHFKIVCSKICPVAYDDGPYTTNEATTLYVSAEDGVLVNDVDDGLPRPLTAHIATGASKGDITLNTDGSFIYTPYLGSVGTDSFTYTAYDGLCYSDPATAYITIIEINHINLQYGWNLISNPVDEPIDKTDIIVRYAGYDYTWDQAVGYNIIVEYVYGWDINMYAFEDTFVPGEGYWVYSYKDCEFLIPSNAVPDNHVTYLDASWNLVGLPYDIDLAKTDLSIQYLGQYYTWDQAVTNGYIVNFVYGWDRTNQNYMLSDNFVLGYGYWVYSYVDCVLKIS